MVKKYKINYWNFYCLSLVAIIAKKTDVLEMEYIDCHWKDFKSSAESFLSHHIFYLRLLRAKFTIIDLESPDF